MNILIFKLIKQQLVKLTASLSLFVLSEDMTISDHQQPLQMKDGVSSMVFLPLNLWGKSLDLFLGSEMDIKMEWILYSTKKTDAGGKNCFIIQLTVSGFK